MLIIGAGWGRTGTSSLSVALERLTGGPCLHMTKMESQPQLLRASLDAIADRPVDWSALLEGWTATVDWPGCWQWRTFADLWPHAPVLLTVCDPDEWYSSVRRSIHVWTRPGRGLANPDQRELVDRLWLDDFGGWEQVYDKEHAISCFDAHNASAREQCPPDRLVEWRISDGWAPICRALGLPEPHEPFPHLNRS